MGYARVTRAREGASPGHQESFAIQEMLLHKDRSQFAFPPHDGVQYGHMLSVAGDRPSGGPRDPGYYLEHLISQVQDDLFDLLVAVEPAEHAVKICVEPRVGGQVLPLREPFLGLEVLRSEEHTSELQSRQY